MSKKRDIVLGPDAIAVIERLAVVPFESVRELTASTGLPADRVIAAMKKLEKLGLINSYQIGRTTTYLAAAPN